MERDILQNHFETVYKEYKDYESFAMPIQDSIISERKGFMDRVLNGNEREDSLLDSFFDLSVKPLQTEEDLRILRDRLINVYDSYKIVIDFPTEIISEINNLSRPYQAYRIDNGFQIEIDKERNEKFKSNVRQKHSELINQIKLQ